MTRVAASRIRSAEKIPTLSPVPGRPLDSTDTRSPVRSLDHAAPVPRSVSRSEVSGVSSSGAATSRTRRSRASSPTQ